ncbi:MAG: PD-(D/E)XK nuclease-like domain-containing protein [Phycisphaeraceae bacterium]|nr:PD-(D/E)XK nuclease-like domain-containing protein [Phycisphaeraceae bacterium]
MARRDPQHPHRPGDSTPLVRLGQGAFTRDINASDLSANPETVRMPAAASIDLHFLHRESADVYHARAREHLTSHALADFRRCPLLFRRKELGLIRERDTEAYLVGRAAHVLVLEGRQRFEAEFAVGGPVNPRTGQPFGSGTKAFAEWAAKVGKPVLADDQAALVEQMAVSVREHMFARELLADGVAEGVVRCEYAGHRCQARIDWVNPVEGRGIVDLKTCDRLDCFELDIGAFGYVHQLAFYRALVYVASAEELPVHIIAVEKREPFRCGVWQLSDRVLEQARRENERAIQEMTRCRATGVWPTRFESLRLFDRL